MKNMYVIGVVILLSAIIWGAVILGTSLALKGTGCYKEIQNIIQGGAVAHLILIWGPLGSFFVFYNKKKKEASDK